MSRFRQGLRQQENLPLSAAHFPAGVYVQDAQAIVPPCLRVETADDDCTVEKPLLRARDRYTAVAAQRRGSASFSSSSVGKAVNTPTLIFSPGAHGTNL